MIRTREVKLAIPVWPVYAGRRHTEWHNLKLSLEHGVKIDLKHDCIIIG